MAGASEARPSRRAGALKVRRACSKGIELTNVAACAFAAMRWRWARVAEMSSRVQAGVSRRCCFFTGTRRVCFSRRWVCRGVRFRRCVGAGHACSKGIKLTNVAACAFAAMRWRWARVAEVLSRVQAGWRKSAACAFGCDAALGVSRRMRFPARGSEGILACFARCLHAFVS